MALLDIGKQDLTWDIAQLYPTQGNWTAEEYLLLDTNHLIEFEHGRLEFLPMPSYTHQTIAFLIWQMLRKFFSEGTQNGLVVGAPFPIFLWEDKYREPDVSVVLQENEWRCEETFWRGADIVFEVVSPSNATHDTETKRREYAEAGIPEYWLVDPTSFEIAVLALEGKHFKVVETYDKDSVAKSIILNGFSLDVNELFAAAA